MRTRYAVALLVTSLACRPSGDSVVPDTNAASAQSASSSKETIVRRPTLITSFVTSQAEVDSSSDVNEALSDYQFYLEHVIKVLESNGVDVVATSDSTVRWRDSLGHHAMSAVDSGGILYLFVLPGGQTRALRSGVATDMELVDIARDHFKVAIPKPDSRQRTPERGGHDNG